MSSCYTEAVDFCWFLSSSSSLFALDWDSYLRLAVSYKSLIGGCRMWGVSSATLTLPKLDSVPLLMAELTSFVVIANDCVTVYHKIANTRSLICSSIGVVVRSGDLSVCLSVYLSLLRQFNGTCEPFSSTDYFIDRLRRLMRGSTNSNV